MLIDKLTASPKYLVKLQISRNIEKEKVDLTLKRIEVKLNSVADEMYNLRAFSN